MNASETAAKIIDILEAALEVIDQIDEQDLADFLTPYQNYTLSRAYDNIDVIRKQIQYKQEE